MPKIQATVTLNINDQSYAVEKMSPTVQQLVVMFDEWRQKEVDAQSDLLMLRAALRDLQRELYTTITADRDAAMKAAAAFLPEVAPEVANDAPESNDGQDL